MNTMVGSARRLGRTESNAGGSAALAWRRVAAWWSADAVSARFASARAADERLLGRS
jgi:hypothetical protein